MKITGVQTYLVNPGNRNMLFVKVKTDEGIDGIGEAFSVGPDDAIERTIHYFESWLVGQDPRDIEHIWQMLYGFSRFPTGSVIGAAISGIEHALWDISGKALGVPVYRLLGGKCRQKIRVYQGVGGKTPEECADNAVALIERYGYTALKMGPHPPGSDTMPWNAVVRGAAARLEAVRKAVGPDIDIGLDPHAKIFEPVRALQMVEAVKPYNPFFFEEPLRPENVDALAKLAAHTDVPIATGEALYTKFQFRELLDKQAADIVQPDICITGGILECRKIAAMAEAHYVSVAPHNPMGPVATAVNVHFAASIPNFLILEYVPDDVGPRRELLQEPLQVKDGYIEVPEKPGLGIELNEEVLSRYPASPWHRPFSFRPDGSVALI